MERENLQLITLVEERLQKLKSLAREIKTAQEACVELNLEALRIHDRQKENLCTEIRQLDLEISGIVLNHGPAGSAGAILAAGFGGELSRRPEVARRLEVLLEESEVARAEVRKLNRVYAVFLARSRSTLSVMINVVSHCMGIYPSPDRSGSPSLSFERSY